MERVCLIAGVEPICNLSENSQDQKKLFKRNNVTTPTILCTQSFQVVMFFVAFDNEYEGKTLVPRSERGLYFSIYKYIFYKPHIENFIKNTLQSKPKETLKIQLKYQKLIHGSNKFI